MSRQTGWNETASQTNAIATATKAAVALKQHIVFSVSASYGASNIDGLLEIKDGSTVVWSGFVYNFAQASPTFPAGLSITKGNACSAVLAAGGSAIVGSVNIHGTTT